MTSQLRLLASTAALLAVIGTSLVAQGGFGGFLAQLVDKPLHCSSIALKARGCSTYLCV